MGKKERERKGSRWMLEKAREERNRKGVERMVIGQGDSKWKRNSRIRRVKKEKRIGVKGERIGRRANDIERSMERGNRWLPNE